MGKKLELSVKKMKGGTNMRIRQEEGLTLVEIIVALVILGIISVFVLSSFVGGYAGILRMGQRSNAAADAQGIIDLMYKETQDTGFDGTQLTFSAIMESQGITADKYAYALDLAGLETKTASEQFRVYIGLEVVYFANVSYYPVTILWFYDNDKGSSKITSFIPKKGV